MSQSELLQLNKMFSRKPESYWNDLIKKEKEKMSKQKTNNQKKGGLVLDDPYNEGQESNKHSPNQSPSASLRDSESKRRLEVS